MAQVKYLYKVYPCADTRDTAYIYSILPPQDSSKTLGIWNAKIQPGGIDDSHHIPSSVMPTCPSSIDFPMM